MLAVFAFALALNQPPSLNPPGDAMVRLCNETHVRAGFSVTVPAASGSLIQKGWFNVEPGDCLEGRIGETAGGSALVHARSGTWSWPAANEAVSRRVLCVPPDSHQSVARTPDCPDYLREADHASVEMRRAGRRYTTDYTVSCDAFGAEAGLCRSSPAAGDGFARPVRELQACNVTSEPRLVALAGDATTGRPGDVERWEELAAGACAILYRGFARTGRVQIFSPLPVEPDDVRHVGRDIVVYCGEPGAGELSPRARPGTNCPDGTTAYALRTADYGPQTSRFSMSVN